MSICFVIIARDDEPTSNLDDDNTTYIMDLFTKMHENGKVVIMVTRDKNLEKYATKRIQVIDTDVVVKTTGDKDE